MAHQPHLEVSSYQNVEILRNEENTLGIGSYGAVYRARCDELPCAAKCLHQVFFQFNDPGILDAARKFEQECHFLSTIKHPHIIQYLGTIRDPDSGRLLLLMELMDESLTKFLERQSGSLPYFVQINLSHDVALALAYLHSNGIIHRDLSSNNVLLIAGSRAKVTDFGMSKLIDVNPRVTPLTQCPGTLAYMPPEALQPYPCYTKKLDCFSDGVLIVQIVTRNFPSPTPSMRAVEDSRSPTGVIHIPVSEVERRKNDIDQIDCAHPFLPIALDCLKDRESERPSAQELCYRLAQLKEAQRYAESVQDSNERRTLVENAATEMERQIGEQQELQLQVHHQCQQLQHKDQQLQEKDDVIASHHRDMQQLKEKLQQSNQQIQEKDHAIEAREMQLQELNQRMLTNEQQTSDLQQSLLRKDKVIRSLEDRLARCIQEHLLHGSGSSTGETSIELKWKACRKAPCTMSRGATIVQGSVAYFAPSATTSVYEYDSENEEWSWLPECPNHFFSFAVVKGLLTTIGGLDTTLKATNTLLSLTGQGRNRKWAKQFPPMPTRRSESSAACDGKFLIVAGGQIGSNKLSTVEVMDTENLQWYAASSLPHSFYNATVTICRDNIYLLGGQDREYKATKSVLTCSLTALVQSYQPQSAEARLRRSPKPIPNVWRTIADIPVFRSTCATLRGELVAVGGQDSPYTSTTAIYMYSPRSNSWRVISRMKTARSRCLVGVFQDNRMVVVGGMRTDVVEIANNGRILTEFSGKLYAALDKSVYLLAAVPLKEQVTTLLENQLVEEAVLLAETIAAVETNRDSTAAEEYMCEVKQQAAFICFSRGAFSQAETLFLESGCDPREVIVLFEDLLPGTSSFKSQAGLPSVEALASATGDISVKEAKKFLIRYLKGVRTTSLALGRREDIDTSLVKLLAEERSPSLVHYITDHDLYLAFDDTKEALQKHECYHALGLLFYYSNQSSQALNIWTRIYDGELPDREFPGFHYIVNFLSKCSNAEMVMRYARWALEKDEIAAVRIFTDRNPREQPMEQLKPAVVLDFLSPFPYATVAFLEHLIKEKEVQEERYHTRLASCYLDRVLKLKEKAPSQDLKRAREKLKHFLETSALYRAPELLSRVQDTDLYMECAILYGRMEEHEKALSLLAHKLKDYGGAENYCAIYSKERSRQYRQNLYQTLLAVYLRPKDKSQGTLIRPALSLLNSHGAHFDAAQVLELLPAEWPISTVKGFLMRSLRSSIDTYRTDRIEHNLARGENIQVRSKFIEQQVDPVVITEFTRCPVCNLPFNDAAFVRYPNGTVTHLKCGRNKTICPVTGTWFGE